MPSPDTILACALTFRPIVRKRTPILYPIVRLLISCICPRNPRKAMDLVAPFQGVKINVNTGWSLERHILFAGEYEPTIAGIIRRALKPGDAALMWEPISARNPL